MLSYIEYLKEYLNIPTKIVLVLVILFFALQIIGEILEFKGKFVPEFLKIRKYFARKKKERQALCKMTELLDEHCQMAQTLNEVNRLLNDIDKHYSADNIAMRDGWMKEVNEHIVDSDHKRKEQDNLIRELNEKLDKNNADTLSLLIDNKRNTIIAFAEKVIDESNPVTREQFNRIFKLYEEYECIIEENDLTNGEIDIAYRIITESYEKHMRNHTFIEDVRGY
jgi:hypothetical protein